MQFCEMAKHTETRQKAKALYLTGQYSQKEIGELVGISERSICKWKDADGWDEMKVSLLTTRSNELKRMYLILKNLNDSTIEDIEAKRKVNPADADAVIKYSAAIKKLEVESSIAEKVEVGMAFIDMVRKEDADLAKQITHWFDIFIQQSN